MMVERENGTLDSKARFPSLWESSIEKGETVSVLHSPAAIPSLVPQQLTVAYCRYRHIVTKALQSTPLPTLRGGILADVRQRVSSDTPYLSI